MKEHEYTIEKSLHITFDGETFLKTPGGIGFTEAEVKNLANQLPLEELEEVILDKVAGALAKQKFENEIRPEPISVKHNDEPLDDDGEPDPIANKAEEIINHFSDRGARVSHDDYEWLKATLEL